MRKSKTEAAETRTRIIEVASRAFRLNGIQATGLTDIMAGAGLTQGGFYKHFASKDHLVAEACTNAMTSIVDSLTAVATRSEDGDRFGAVVDAYVSMAHRNTTGGGCPLAAMGSELARADDETRTAATQGFDQLVDLLTARAEGEDGQQAADRSQAAFALAAMIGAVTMSRVFQDETASAALLEDVRQQIHSMRPPMK